MDNGFDHAFLCGDDFGFGDCYSMRVPGGKGSGPILFLLRRRPATIPPSYIISLDLENNVSGGVVSSSFYVTGV